MNWLVFALMTVVSWGVYGVFLHTGRMGMADSQNGLFKAFLFVGIAYFLTAVLAPLLMLVSRGATWQFPVGGMMWSLVAGVAGAIGAFCVLLAFGSKGGTPAVVMSIVFAGAPVVNSIVAVWQHPPAGGISAIKPQFFLGILLAAAGGCLVTLYRPPAPSPAKPAPAASVQTVDKQGTK